jgi:hypothetical protein
MTANNNTPITHDELVEAGFVKYGPIYAVTNGRYDVHVALSTNSIFIYDNLKDHDSLEPKFKLENITHSQLRALIEFVKTL